MFFISMNLFCVNGLFSGEEQVIILGSHLFPPHLSSVLGLVNRLQNDLQKNYGEDFETKQSRLEFDQLKQNCGNLN